MKVNSSNQIRYTFYNLQVNHNIWKILLVKYPNVVQNIKLVFDTLFHFKHQMQFGIWNGIQGVMTPFPSHVLEA